MKETKGMKKILLAMAVAAVATTANAQQNITVWQSGKATTVGNADSIELVRTNVPVDLGLSVKWAPANLGATSPEGYGQYFAFGETEGKTEFSWDNYKFGTSTALTKYTGTDSLTTLEAADDAATAQLGKGWRMPTKDEFDELSKALTWKKTTQNGVSGWLGTSKTNGKTIFFPFPGNYDGTTLKDVDKQGYYRTSTLNTDTTKAWCMRFMTRSRGAMTYPRYRGFAIRPVYEADSTADSGQTILVIAGTDTTRFEHVDSITFAAATPAKPQYRDFTVNGVTFRMILVEGGTYYRGAQSTDPDAPGYVKETVLGSEKPVYSVNITDFYMAETECTQQLWKALYPTYSYFGIKGDSLPCNGQYYSEMNQFITSLNKYLHDNNQLAADENFGIPTESQWEFAARGGNKSHGYRYAGSDSIDQVAWYKQNSDLTLHAVKTKAPNELGLYDMSGNAYEATSDNFSQNYSWAEDGQTDPTGATAKSSYGLTRRGGCYNQTYQRCTVTKRDFYDIDAGGSEDQGFRLILK